MIPFLLLGGPAALGSAAVLPPLLLASDHSRTNSFPVSFFSIHPQDLVGCQVHVKGGSSGGAVAAAAPIGVVRDLISGTGAHDTLLIELARTEDDVAKAQLRTCMVPFAKAIVPVVDVAARRLEIDPPEGLLDICKVVKLRPPRPPPSGAAGPGAKAPAGASTQAGSVAAGSSGGTRGRPSPPAGGGRATDGRGGRGAPAMPFGSTGQRQGDRATQPGRGGSMRSPRPPPPSAAAAGRGPQ